MKQIATEGERPRGPGLAINPDKVCFIIAKARMFDVKELVSDADSGSNANHTFPVLL